MSIREHVLPPLLGIANASLHLTVFYETFMIIWQKSSVKLKPILLSITYNLDILNLKFEKL